jgi:hypothetical protein
MILGVPCTIDGCVGVAKLGMDTATVGTAAIGITSLAAAGIFACQAVLLIRDLRRGG